MNNLIVGVATPVYPINAGRKDLVAVNKLCKQALTDRFPGSEIVYDGLANGASAPPAIKFYAKLPTDSEVAKAILAASGGRRPVCSRGFAGAFLVTVDSNGPVSTAVAGLTAESLDGKTLKELTEIGAARGIKITRGTSKAKAIAALIGTPAVAAAPVVVAEAVAPETPAAEVETTEVVAETPAAEEVAEVLAELGETVSV
jgi:hypothetical protein